MWNDYTRSGVMVIRGHKSTLLLRRADSELDFQKDHSSWMPRRSAASRTRSTARPVGFPFSPSTWNGEESIQPIRYTCLPTFRCRKCSHATATTTVKMTVSVRPHLFFIKACPSQSDLTSVPDLTSVLDRECSPGMSNGIDLLFPCRIPAACGP